MSPPSAGSSYPNRFVATFRNDAVRLLVGPEPRAALDSLVLRLDDSKQMGSFDSFVKKRKKEKLSRSPSRF